MEYVAHPELTTATVWSANYHIDGDIDTTVNSSLINYGTDGDSNYYLFTDNTQSCITPSYNTINYILNIDNDGNSAYANGFSFEAWIKYTGTEGNISNSKGWLMTAETGWGPAIVLNDERFNGRNIATPPGNNTFTSSTPGPITSYTNQMVHIVGWYQSNDHGVYVNGINYDQNAGTPGADNFDNRVFTVGQHVSGSNGHHCPGVRIYAFRVWHQKLEQADVDELYSSGHDSFVVEPTI